jgi:prefoldin alpha subunit
MDQAKLAEYKTVVENLRALQEQVAGMERHALQLKSLRDSLTSLGAAKEDDEILIPLGVGYFFKGKKSADNKVLTGVGAEVIIERSFEEGQSIVDEQIGEVEKVLNQMQINLNFLMQKQQELEKFLGGGCCGDHESCSC